MHPEYSFTIFAFKIISDTWKEKSMELIEPGSISWHDALSMVALIQCQVWNLLLHEEPTKTSTVECVHTRYEKCLVLMQWWLTFTPMTVWSFCQMSFKTGPS